LLEEQKRKLLAKEQKRKLLIKAKKQKLKKKRKRNYYDPPLKWMLSYPINGGNSYHRVFKPRHTKIGERIEQELNESLE